MLRDSSSPSVSSGPAGPAGPAFRSAHPAHWQRAGRWWAACLILLWLCASPGLGSARPSAQPQGAEGTAEEAHGFLLAIPDCEAAGVAVRVPDWWKGRRPARVQAGAEVGAREPAGLGLDAGLVSSPTFVIANIYEGAAGDGTSRPPRPLAHVDLYRVESAAALDDAGFMDLLDPGAIVAVEWADRLPDALPRDHLELRIGRETEAAGPSRGGSAQAPPRVLNAVAFGPVSQAALSRWETALAER